MELSAALARDLALLSDALDEDGAPDGTRVDLAESLTRTVRAARAAVDSFAGLAVLTGPADTDLRFIVLHDGASPADVRASLRVPFRAASDGESPAVIFFASTPGAFVDLAADIAWLTGRDPAELVLDQHLQVPDDMDSAGTVAVRSAVDQAVGVLLAHGRTPEQARADLERRAANDGGDLRKAAEQTIADLVAHPVESGLDDRADDVS